MEMSKSKNLMLAWTPFLFASPQNSVIAGPREKKGPRQEVTLLLKNRLHFEDIMCDVGLKFLISETEIKPQKN
jgi:hypothetical protein